MPIATVPKSLEKTYNVIQGPQQNSEEQLADLLNDEIDIRKDTKQSCGRHGALDPFVYASGLKHVARERVQCDPRTSG